MSSIREDFYGAINKANNQKPKIQSKPKKEVKESVSIEDQIKNLLNESESAVIEKETPDNQIVVEWVYNMTKNSIEKDLDKEFEELNKQREQQRKEWLRRMRMMELVSNPTSPSTSSSSAGAGGSGGGSGLRRNQQQKYFEFGYIEFGYIE